MRGKTAKVLRKAAEFGNINYRRLKRGFRTLAPQIKNKTVLQMKSEMQYSIPQKTNA